MPVGISRPVSGHLTMTAPIELSLFRRSIRRHTPQLCEHQLTRRRDRRKFIELAENAGSKKIRDLYQPKFELRSTTSCLCRVPLICDVTPRHFDTARVGPKSETPISCSSRSP